MKNPKLEFYRIDLKPTKDSNDITFRDVFTELYIEEKPSKKGKEVRDETLMKAFLSRFLGKINDKFEIDNNKRKAFFVKKQRGVNDAVKFGSSSNIIHGRIKGGPYDTGKEEGDLANPEGDNRKFKKSTIILDDFYFLLYMPLDKSIGVLLLHNYTSDRIADVFIPFVKGLFKIKKLTYKPKIEHFMPEEMQEDFKENSTIKKFVFSNSYIINDLDDSVQTTGKFTIQITVSSSDQSINTKNLKIWKKALRKINIKIPGNEVRSVETFAKQTAYIKDNNSKSNPTIFRLDDEKLQIIPTIYLTNHINLEENGVPKWGQLEKFAHKVLTENVIPEIYPENNLDES